MTLTYRNIRILLALLGFSLIVNACGIYSFTGASVPPEVKTISIDFFPNQADIVNPTLAQDFTDELRDRFISQTNLKLINGGADWEIKGAIVTYREVPAAPDAQGAALNKLIVEVRCEFTNNFNETKSFSQKISGNQLYSGNQSLSDVEDQIIPDIIEQIVNNIFNKIAVDW